MDLSSACFKLACRWRQVMASHVHARLWACLDKREVRGAASANQGLALLAAGAISHKTA